MKQYDAKRIVRTSIRAMALLDQLLHESREALPPPQYERLKTVVALIMGDISLDMLRPVFLEHPSLQPIEGDHEGWNKAGGLYDANWLEIPLMPPDEDGSKSSEK